jgi:DNA (cytosine-5)-methyltransferase 1
MGFDRPGQPRFRIPVSDTQAYRQFGNSVVVPVVEAVARHMAPFVTGADAAGTEHLQRRLPLSA